MVVIPSGQNIHPSAGADAVLTQAPTIDCHWRLLTLDLQRVQGHRAGSRLLRHTGVQFAAIHIQKLDFHQEQVLACRGGSLSFLVPPPPRGRRRIPSAGSVQCPTL